MNEEVDDGIKRKPAKNNPWYDFLLKSIELDKGDEGARESKPYGWHWFWGIYGLYREIPTFPQLNIDVIKKQLPDNRCINFNPYEEERLPHPEMKYAREMQQEAINALYKILKESNSLETVKKIDFSKWDFPEYADLSYIIFPIDTSFEHTSFATSPNFSNTIFCDKVSFSRAVFIDNVFFNGAQFFYEASFVGTKFCHEVFSDPCFDKAVFSGRALFTYAKFEGKIFFKETIFSKDAIFQDTKFTWGANFKKAKFFESAIFTNANFLADIKFDWTTFEGHTDFINTKFKKYVPSFHKAVIHSNISWDMTIKHWPLLKKSKDESITKIINHNKNTYENLASHMKTLDKYHDEHFFYRQEMRCRRQLEKNPFIRFPNTAYEWLADYGYGFGYALLGWFLHILLGAVLIWATTKNALCAFPVSFANAHGFLPFRNAPLEKCYEPFVENDIFNAISVTQTILGIIFLFLVLLTLRVRFRLK